MAPRYWSGSRTEVNGVVQTRDWTPLHDKYRETECQWVSNNERIALTDMFVQYILKDMNLQLIGLRNTIIFP